MAAPGLGLDGLISGFLSGTLAGVADDLITSSAWTHAATDVVLAVQHAVVAVSCVLTAVAASQTGPSGNGPAADTIARREVKARKSAFSSEVDVLKRDAAASARAQQAAIVYDGNAEVAKQLSAVIAAVPDAPAGAGGTYDAAVVAAALQAALPSVAWPKDNVIRSVVMSLATLLRRAGRNEEVVAAICKRLSDYRVDVERRHALVSDVAGAFTVHLCGKLDAAEAAGRDAVHLRVLMRPPSQRATSTRAATAAAYAGAEAARAATAAAAGVGGGSGSGGAAGAAGVSGGAAGAVGGSARGAAEWSCLRMLDADGDAIRVAIVSVPVRSVDAFKFNEDLPYLKAVAGHNVHVVGQTAAGNRAPADRRIVAHGSLLPDVLAAASWLWYDAVAAGMVGADDDARVPPDAVPVTQLSGGTQLLLRASLKQLVVNERLLATPGKYAWTQRMVSWLPRAPVLCGVPPGPSSKPLVAGVVAPGGPDAAVTVTISRRAAGAVAAVTTSATAGPVPAVQGAAGGAAERDGRAAKRGGRAAKHGGRAAGAEPQAVMIKLTFGAGDSSGDAALCRQLAEEVRVARQLQAKPLGAYRLFARYQPPTMADHAASLRRAGSAALRALGAVPEQLLTPTQTPGAAQPAPSESRLLAAARDVEAVAADVSRAAARGDGLVAAGVRGADFAARPVADLRMPRSTAATVPSMLGLFPSVCTELGLGNIMLPPSALWQSDQKRVVRTDGERAVIVARSLPRVAGRAAARGRYYMLRGTIALTCAMCVVGADATELAVAQVAFAELSMLVVATQAAAAVATSITTGPDSPHRQRGFEERLTPVQHAAYYDSQHDRLAAAVIRAESWLAQARAAYGRLHTAAREAATGNEAILRE